jgi:hypothetical protein
MAVMILVLALTLPALERPLAYERLRRSADQVMSAWASGRVAAMRSGDHRVFRYGEDAQGRAEYWFDGDPAMELERPKLPEGITFAGSMKAEDAREYIEDDGATDAAEAEIWFYADGTCSEVPELILRNEYGMQIRLMLRGMTGVAYIDENVPDADPTIGLGRASP